jgi:hypothetical protein
MLTQMIPLLAFNQYLVYYYRDRRFRLWDSRDLSQFLHVCH